MKKLLTICLIMLCAFIIKAQTGNGIVAQINSPYAFTPTTVDSTTTIDVVFVNTVAAQQTLTLTGIAAPFSISTNSVLISASDSITIQLSFNPTVVGNFSDTLDFIGSIFGSGSLVVNSEGVQVTISTSTDSLNLGSISLGTSVTDSFMISNTGTGTMALTNISSNNTDFTVSPTTATIAQGASMYVSITYTPVLSGLSTATIAIASNDPNTPIYNVFVEGTGVSEISGAVCGTLSLINSPFTLTGDITVADSCTLTIEPGVTIYGNRFDLVVEGQLIANGTSSDSISILDLQKININNFAQINYCNINQSTTNSLFFEDFESDNGSALLNWTGDINYLSWGETYGYDDGKGIQMQTTTGDKQFYTGPITMNSEKCLIEFDYNIYTESSTFMRIYYSINSNGTWVSLANLTNNNSWSSWSEAVYDLSSVLNTGDQIEFKFVCDYSNSTYNYVNFYMDNFRINYLKDVRVDINTDNNFTIESSSIKAKKLTIDNNMVHLDFEDGNINPGDFQTEDNWDITQTYSSKSSYSIKNINTWGELVLEESVIDSGYVAFSFDYFMYYIHNNSYVRAYYRLNGGSWVEFWDDNTYASNAPEHWTTVYHQIPSSLGDEVEFRFYSSMWNNQTHHIYLDNLKIFNNQAPEFSINNSDIIADLSFSGNATIENTEIKATQYGVTSHNGSLMINQSTLDGGETVLSFNELLLTINNSTLKNGDDKGIYVKKPDANIALYNTTIKDCGGNGIDIQGDNSVVDLKYSFVKDNGGVGIKTDDSYMSNVNLSSSMVTGNGNYGIECGGQVNANYSNITFNNNEGIYLTGNNFSNIKNSIIWGNDIVNYHQIHTSSGVSSITYSSIQGSGAYGTSGGQYYYGDGSIDDDPVFADSEQHMSSFSNCVDAGTPWELDANMPYGLGGVRADIGIYGGPDNWFWGGTPVPDGAPVLTSIEDSPQDQGGIAGVLFDASVWDNSTLVNNVTHYSIWRNYDISGATVDSVNEGNWQMMGSMQAQSFSAYAYEAATLGDSSIANGMFNNCYVVVAHTGDSATFWYSNVMCGYSTDDMAPSAPIASAMPVANTDDVLVYWDAPAVPDYAYSNVISTNGFTSLGVVDTMTLDVSTLSGGTYTYGVVHFDVNGNASDTAWVTITLADNEDVIPLTAGWNLISTNKSPNNNDMTNIFSSLMPGNLVYVTAFNQGSSLYNPNGLPFLNTLTQFTDGYGYWVKVLVDDTLSISGTTIPATYKIPLNANWNLSGYMNTTAEAPTSYLGTLIANNNLVYCTGFNQGTLLFNPNGLPFLNTLNSMQRPFGYWIKVNNAVGSGSYRMANNEGAKFSPEFMFVNGTSNLESHVGSFVEVLNSANELVAKLEIVNGGYLMTTALYGDDPTTEMIEGLQEGEYLTFKFNGEEFYSTVSFNGNMELKTIDLEFSNGGAWSIYPNPLSTTTTINYQLNTTAHVSIKVFDIAGRQIDELVNARQDASYYTQIWNATNFEKGVYMMELHINGTKITNERLILQ